MRQMSFIRNPFAIVFVTCGISTLALNGQQSCPASPCPQTCGSPYCPYQMAGPVDYCTFPNTGCPQNYHAGNLYSGNENPGCCCYDYSPILIDVGDGGYKLTNAERGVWFDMTGSKRRLRVAWTAPGTRQGWLTLDRNSNGIVDDGTELFGNHTPQPPSLHPNGFLALAVYDSVDSGGDGNGRIDANDRIYARLRLWLDLNHNGISEPGELVSLASEGVRAIHLDHQEFKKKDRFGNEFRYRGRVESGHDADVAHWAWDIFLTATSTVAPSVPSKESEDN